MLVLQRAATLRNHAGQPAFPGGAADPDDADPAGDRAARGDRGGRARPGQRHRAWPQLPRLWIPVSDFVVTPVLAWWHAPHAVRPRDPAEVAHVARLPVAELVDPANRLRVRHPSGWIGPAFEVRGMLVWGFTAGVLSALLDMAGWARPWPRDRVGDLPPIDDARAVGRHRRGRRVARPRVGSVAGRPYPERVSVVDVVLVLLMMVFAISGYRQGFVIGVLSFVGFFGGALVGLQLGPLIARPVRRRRDPGGRLADRDLRAGRARPGPGRLARHPAAPRDHQPDRAGGSTTSAARSSRCVAVLLVAWLVAVPLGVVVAAVAGPGGAQQRASWTASTR